MHGLEPSHGLRRSTRAIVHGETRCREACTPAADPWLSGCVLAQAVRLNSSYQNISIPFSFREADPTGCVIETNLPSLHCA